MCRDFYRDRRDKSRLSRQIKIFEIFEGNRDFVEINRDVVKTFRTFFGFSKQKFEFPTLFASKQINVGNLNLDRDYAYNREVCKNTKLRMRDSYTNPYETKRIE
jgi:hypothetical protein